jgi:hypothetical protein
MRTSDRSLLVSALKTGFDAPYGIPAERDAATSLLSLASALSASSQWREMPHATLVVRSSPESVLGVMGYFDEAGRARLEGLRWQLDNVLPRLRYVGYEEAERESERLAERLVERFGREELEGFHFAAMPRGGFIVLGMLAYALGLRRGQLEPGPPDSPVVLVDDCAVSGVRFGEWMSRSKSEKVVFAHLYSAPELREAIEEKEGRVACVAARDLEDHAPGIHGEGYTAWRERWLARMDYGGYWVGHPDHVCFAWNEPDTSIWNPVTEKEEAGWRLVPPELCLKNRPEPAEGHAPIQFQPEGKGPIRPSSRVLFGELEGGVVIGDLEGGECFGLDGVGADMWRCIVEFGDRERAGDEILKAYDVDEVTLRGDLDGFVDELISRGILEERG